MFGWFRKRRAGVVESPPPPESACFVCDGSRLDFDRDGPGYWLGPRYACREHCNAAILPSGESLTNFLALHTGDHQLEGSGLGWLLNPVSIAGTRAWADFAGGGWAVLEEVFASDSQFDFWAQHRPDCVDTLYQLYPPVGARAGRSAPDQGGVRAVMSQQVLLAQFGFHQRLEDGFRRRGTRDFASPTELIEFWALLHPPGENLIPVGGSEFDEYLRGLAGRRFQRLCGSAAPGTLGEPK